MKISVIIPYFNRSHTIERCLQSVSSQTFHNLECIVIDDGSSESEAEALESIMAEFSDDRYRLIHLDTNTGGGAARNRGMEVAQGEYLAFLDSDDEWLPEKLQMQLEFAVASKTKFISCQSFVHHSNGIGILPARSMGSESIADYLFCQNGWLQTSSFLIQKDALEDVRFDETLPRHQDYDLLFQLQEKSIKPEIIETPLVKVHWEDLETSGRAVNIANSERFAKSRRRFFSEKARSCFVAKFVIIPIAKSKGRRQAIASLRDTGIGFLSNKNLALEVISTFVYKDGRLLRYAASIKGKLS